MPAASEKFNDIYEGPLQSGDLRIAPGSRRESHLSHHRKRHLRSVMSGHPANIVEGRYHASTASSGYVPFRPCAPNTHFIGPFVSGAAPRQRPKNTAASPTEHGGPQRKLTLSTGRRCNSSHKANAWTLATERMVMHAV